jgi:ketosteroid isomerase-like protein
MDDDSADPARRAANLEVFKTVQATISAGEFARLPEYMTDDLEFDLPYAPSFMTMPMHGLDGWNQMQLMTFGLFSSFTLTLDTVHECLDPDELVAEYHSDAVVKRNGNEYRNRYLGVLRFRDGKICFWREFHDPRATDVL